MVKKSSRRILLYPAAAMLFGAVALPSGFAREQSHPKSARSSAHHATPDSTKKGEVNIPISVQHSGHSDHDNTAAGPKTFKIAPSNHAHVFATKPSTGSSVVGRNAIGLPIVRPEVALPDNAVPFSHLPTQPSGPPASGMSSFPNRNLATTQFTVPHASPPPANLSSGKIDGTALARRPAAGLGGPSIPIGGINGTAFVVRKH
jgi:hypothetical protein